MAALTRTLHRCAAALRCDSTTLTAAVTAAHCAPSRTLADFCSLTRATPTALLLLLGHTMQAHTTKTYDMRSHQKKTALTKISGALLLKWLTAFCVLDCVGAAPVSGPAAPCYGTNGCASPSPHFVKPRHTVWHNGTELENQVIVKLVDDRNETPISPELLAGSTAQQHAILSIGSLNLNAEPVFPNHYRRRKLQAGVPRDPLHLFFKIDAPDGNGAALCDQLNNDPSVEIAYLAPVHATVPIATSSDDQRRTLQAIRHALASKTDLRRMLSPSFVDRQGIDPPTNPPTDPPTHPPSHPLTRVPRAGSQRLRL